MAIADMKETLVSKGVQYHQLVCFKIADEEYAIKITDIQEVVRVPKITPLPQVPDFVLGVINLRGYVITVFDLRKKLHLPAKAFDNKTKIVVAKIKETMFSMIVDEILENTTLDQSQIDPAPSVKMKIPRDCVSGLGELEGRMITILNLDKIHEEIRTELGCDRKKTDL